MNYIAIDTETCLIEPGRLAPPLVCLTAAKRTADGEIETYIFGVPDDAVGIARSILEDPEHVIVGQNIAYDLAVLAAECQDLMPLIWNALTSGRVLDLAVREKLLNISTSGSIDVRPMPDGTNQKLQYSLAALAKLHLGLDLSADKDAEDSWRLHYAQLRDVPAAQYPEEARRYALDDARTTLLVFEAQERLVSREGFGRATVATQDFQTAVAFALHLATCWGLRIDLARRDEIAARLEAELVAEKMTHLISSGILRPGEAPRPIKNRKPLADGSLPMTGGKAESINLKALAARVESVALKAGIPIRFTKPSSKHPSGQISTESDFLEELAPFDAAIAEYVHRQAQMKMVQEVRKLTGSRVYPNFNVLVESGRTSSYGSPRNKPALYPSNNIQQQHPLLRAMYEADDGWLIGSCDYNALELVSLAQRCYTLFGQSKLRDLINSGRDPHTYLGARLAFELDADFRDACSSLNVYQPDDLYKLFASIEDHEDEEVRARFKHYRKFAKPVGLGYPGGLGPATFCALARATYEIEVDEDLAKRLKQIWLETYPEMVEFFRWVNRSCVDPDNTDRYAYTTPGGMYRAGATYCATCNGTALQSPAAEGAKLAVLNVQREMYDRTRESPLFGCRTLAFIHDEILFTIPDDKWAHERATRVAHIMVESMSVVLPEVKVKAAPALMKRWDKEATPVYGHDGRLGVWIPKEQTR